MRASLLVLASSIATLIAVASPAHPQAADPVKVEGEFAAVEIGTNVVNGMVTLHAELRAKSETIFTSDRLPTIVVTFCNSDAVLATGTGTITSKASATIDATFRASLTGEGRAVCTSVGIPATRRGAPVEETVKARLRD